jgi:hypothetical protein
MQDLIVAQSFRWRITTDGLQWILQRRKPSGAWEPLSFVRSTKDILARCLREKGADGVTAAQLLAGLPDTFDEFLVRQNRLQSPSSTTPIGVDLPAARAVVLGD